jgi:hypothetical protein
MSIFQASLLLLGALGLGLQLAVFLWVSKFFKVHAVTVLSSSEAQAGPVVARKKHLGDARIQLREKYAKDAIAYAEQLGAATPRTKLDHAVGYFKKLDESDNGHRDFTDAEIRLSIEAELGKR